MSTLTLTITFTILFAAYMGYHVYKQLKFSATLLEKCKSAATDIMSQGGITVYVVEKGVLSQFGGGCAFSPKIVAIEDGVPAAILEHELRHAKRGHMFVKLFTLVLGTAVVVALPFMVYNDVIAAIGTYLLYAVVQIAVDLILEIDADRIKRREELSNYLQTKVEEYQGLLMPKICKWLTIQMLQTRIKALA